MKKLTLMLSAILLSVGMLQAYPYGTCPGVDDPDNPTKLPDSNLCNVYYVCANGTPYYAECAGGFYWSCTSKVCVVPEVLPACPCNSARPGGALINVHI